MKYNLWGDSVLIDYFESEEFYDIVHQILNNNMKKGEGVKISNKNGFQTPNIFHQYIHEKILEWVATVLKKEYIFKKEFEIQLLNLWINQNKKYSYNDPHTHPESDLSGVYYLDVPKNSGDIYFKDFKKEFSSLNNFFIHRDFMSYKSIKNYKNQFLLFPSNFIHGVDINMTESPRVSVAFNIRLQNKIK
jgi:uncharacterized protein (TIGR02466 family)|tara:strand:- start:2010 stop:2579 length:570 start_codon:yes stop_codon:yes gene_type:complete